MPDDATAKERTPWEKFRAATRQVLSVSKDELAKRESAWRKKRAKKRRGTS